MTLVRSFAQGIGASLAPLIIAEFSQQEGVRICGSSGILADVEPPIVRFVHLTGRWHPGCRPAGSWSQANHLAAFASRKDSSFALSPSADYELQADKHRRS